MSTEQDIKEFVKTHISKIIKVNEINEDLPLDSTYGFESMDALSLGAELEDEFGVELDINVFFEHRTINQLAHAVFLIAKEV